MFFFYDCVRFGRLVAYWSIENMTPDMHPYKMSCISLKKKGVQQTSNIVRLWYNQQIFYEVTFYFLTDLFKDMETV